MGIVMHRSTESEVKVKLLSPVQLFATPWTVAYQAPPSMGFSRQEYWSGLPFPSPGDLPHLGIESESPTLQTDTLPSEPRGKSHVTENSRQNILAEIKLEKVLKKSPAALAAVKSNQECFIALICLCNLSKSKLMLELFYIFEI